ncbi:MAG: recombinase family protein [Candidatus Moranbacteria bacterium]|nr:recombinase family protein [Candidatus Moranbacteria bacterium]
MNQEGRANKYILYARKSSESEDRQMASIDSQIDELSKLAKDNGLRVIEVMQESMSAKAPGRKVFNEMIEKIKKGEADGILCWKLNRLARNPVDGGTVSWALQNEIIKHVFTFGRSYYPTDNVLMMAVELGMANQFIRDLSTDTKRGLRNKAERGWYPNGSPLGYRHNPIKLKGEKEIIKDPEKFEVIQKMLKMVASGKLTPPEAYRKGTAEWGFTNKHNQKVAISSWYAMMNNPFYYGYYEFPSDSGQWFKGKHEPMITQAEFEKTQIILGRRGTTRPRKYSFKYTGAVRCGICEASVVAEHKVKKCKNGKTHYYIYYHCSHRLDPKCDQKVVEEKKLEEEIIGILKRIKIHPTFLDWAIEKLRKENKEEIEEKKQLSENRKKEYEACDRKLDTLLNMRINGELSEGEFITKKDELTKEKARLKANLDAFENNSTHWIDQLEETKELLNLAQDSLDKFKNGDEAKRKEIFRSIGSNLSLSEKKLNIRANNKLIGLEIISSELSSIFKKFEPLNLPEDKEKLELLYSSSPVLLRR